MGVLAEDEKTEVAEPWSDPTDHVAVADPARSVLPLADSVDRSADQRDAGRVGADVDSRRRVLFVSSAGGHLSQLLQLEPWWRHHDRRWVTFDLPDARSKLEGEDLVPAHYPTTRNVFNMVRNYRLASRLLSEWRPDVVISNGAGTAVPFFIEASRRNIPTVYLEVYDRIDSRTLTGRLVHRFTTQFCVQWPGQQRLYDDSTLVGPLY